MNRGDSRPLVYPPVVIAHIARDLADLYAPRAEGKDLIEIHYSAQLNGHPHIGTMASLAVAFAGGQYLSEAYGIPAVLRFEALENAPAVQKKVGGSVYSKTYWDVYEGNRPRAEVFMDSFRRLLEYFSQSSGVGYSVIYYKEFQALPFVRRTLLEILDRQDEFIPFIAPTERYLRIRFPCPVCSFAEKTAKKTRVAERRDKNDLTLGSCCFEHGEHTIVLTPDNAEFVGFNTSIRNVIKEAKFIEDARTLNALNLMVDGGDWVGMALQVAMTTGYDCEDLLNLCLMRPIFSPTYFIQMKGRGTRPYFFKYEHKRDGQREEITKKKKHFKLFDFFANYEYFEEKFNYDEVLKLPHRGTGNGGGEPIDIDEIIITKPDPLKTLTQAPVGPEGMKVDRKLFESFEEKVKKDDFIRKNYEEGDIDTVEEYIKEEIFDKPEDYINLEKLRRSARLDRRLTLREVIDKVFGQLDRFKTKDELLEEEFSKFVLTRKPDSERVINLKNYFKAYVTDPAIRQIIDEGDFAQLATNPKLSMAELKQMGRKWQTSVPEYVKDYVSINRFL